METPVFFSPISSRPGQVLEIRLPFDENTFFQQYTTNGFDMYIMIGYPDESKIITKIIPDQVPSLDMQLTPTADNYIRMRSLSPQLSPVPTITTVPSIPSVPSIRSTVRPEIPIVPSVPTITSVPSVPSVPSIRSTVRPEIPMVPSVPTITSVPSVPSIRSTVRPEIPMVPTVPTITSVPSIRSTVRPEIPMVPSVPTITSLPSIRSTVRPEIPMVPSVPTVPTVPTITSIRSTVTPRLPSIRSTAKPEISTSVSISPRVPSIKSVPLPQVPVSPRVLDCLNNSLFVEFDTLFDVDNLAQYSWDSFFNEFGTVTNVEIKSKDDKSLVIITFKDKRDVDKAYEHLISTNFDFLGSKITVFK